MFLVQTWYKDEAAWRTIAEEMEKAMGEQDAVEHLLSGPPLVGAFEGPNDDFTAPPHDAEGGLCANQGCHLTLNVIPRS